MCKVSGDSIYGAPKTDSSENTTTISDLPPEILEMILCLLDGTSLKASNEVSNYWNERTINPIKTKAFSALTNFANFLADKIEWEIYPSQREVFLNIKNDERILHAETLAAIKLPIDEIKEKIISTLKELSEFDLKNLEIEAVAENKISEFFNVFKLIEQRRIEHRKRLKEINTESNENVKEKNFKEFFTRLIAENDICLALEALEYHSRESNKSSLLKNISQELFEKGKSTELKPEESERLIDQAFKAADLIPLIHDKHSIFVILFKQLAELENFDKISKTVNQFFPEPSHQINILKQCVRELINEKKFDHIIKFLEIMSPNSFSRDNSLVEISMKLAVEREYSLSRQVANMISNADQKIMMLSSIPDE